MKSAAVLLPALLLSGCAALLNNSGESNNDDLINGLALLAAAQGRPAPPQAWAPRPAPILIGQGADFDWEWDQFMLQNGQVVWACRGVQTGQFAPEQRCAYKLKTDWKWPGLQFRP